MKMIMDIKMYIRKKIYKNISRDLPGRLDITDTERMERRKQATKEWKQRKKLSDPEWHEEQKKYYYF